MGANPQEMGDVRAVQFEQQRTKEKQQLTDPFHFGADYPERAP